MEIVYTGLQQQTLQWLKNEIKGEPIFTALAEQEFTHLNNELLQRAGIVLIGENANNPIRLAQQVYQQDRYVSVLLINEEANHRKIKQALQFTPFVGPTILPVSNQARGGLSLVVSDHLQRTEQRRNYARIKASALAVQTSASSSFDRIKHQYVDKVLQEAPIGIILLNGESIIQSFNNYAVELFNKSERDVLGIRFGELFTEDNQQEIEIFLKQEGSYNRKKTIILRSESGQRYIEITLSDLLQKEAAPYKVVLISDITHQVLSQRILEETARKIELILESLPQIAWTANVEGKTTYLNAQWYQYTGCSPQLASSFYVRDFLHPQDVEHTLALWQNSLQTGEKFQTEYRLKRGLDGMYRWMLSRALPLRNEEGNITLWVGTTTDIHDLKIAEQELQRVNEQLIASNQELAATNEELTAANEEVRASNEELAIANRQLSRVNADMDNFIYTASHDLKAPIANIDGLIKILEKKLGKKELQDHSTRELIGMIHASIDRFKATIGDLADITKLQKQIEDIKESVSLLDVFNDVKLDLHHQIEESNAEILLDIAACKEIIFSRKNLKSILYNLLSNAIKYRSPQRRLKVLISCKKEQEYSLLTIEDNGLGIDLKDKDKIFAMFKRMHSHVEGSGIGLYIVKKIIDNAGGKIEVDSQVDKGSIFRVYFRQ